jgi:hypothetical protein
MTITACSQLTTPVQAVEQTIAPISGNLIVKVAPNPTSNYFTITLQSAAKENIKVHVFDVTGREMEEVLDVYPNSTIQLAMRYHPGVYFAEIIQGTDRVVLKLIKEGN